MKNNNNRIIGVLITAVLSFLSPSAIAAPEANLWPYWKEKVPGIMSIVTNEDYADVLSRYVVTHEGQTYFDYQAVTMEDRKQLSQYVARLERRDPRAGLSRDAQFAYWVNLYNARTLLMILEAYPVKSITKLGGLFDFGPWDDEALQVSDKALSLNDVEHRILRPIWKDNRIHYAVNCASLGCPNLKATPWNAENLDQQLNQAAYAFVNHPRAVRFEGGQLVLSSIYDWYQVDFIDPLDDRPELKQVISHLKAFASPELYEQLSGYDLSRGVTYDYDWSLNVPPSR